MFGDPVVNEKGWEVKKWKELFETRLGKMLDKKKQNPSDKSLQYLATQHLTGEKLNMIPLPLPPLPLQQSFASKVEKIESEKHRINSSLKDLEMLLASRMQYWFDG